MALGCVIGHLKAFVAGVVGVQCHPFFLMGRVCLSGFKVAVMV